MGVLNIYYYADFLFILIAIVLIMFAFGTLRERLTKNEKTAKMLQKIKELWRKIADEEDHYE